VPDVEPAYNACERLRPLLEWLAKHTIIGTGGEQPAAHA
jgi:hypothetical protein